MDHIAFLRGCSWVAFVVTHPRMCSLAPHLHTAESTEISPLAQGDPPQTCLFHQNLRPTFSATVHVV